MSETITAEVDGVQVEVEVEVSCGDSGDHLTPDPYVASAEASVPDAEQIRNLTSAESVNTHSNDGLYVHNTETRDRDLMRLARHLGYYPLDVDHEPDGESLYIYFEHADNSLVPDEGE